MPSNIEEPPPSSRTLEIAVIPPAGTMAGGGAGRSGGAARASDRRDTLVVGTSAAADLVVHDPTVSSRHCALSVLGDGVAIEDLGSRNGTFVGSARVREAWGARGTDGDHRALDARRRSRRRRARREPAGRASARTWPGLRSPCGASPTRCAGSRGTRCRCSSPARAAPGKELVARALHQEGPRRALPFVAINVTALPRELVESELFGHERGAFTGAHARRLGAFAEADGGHAVPRRGRATCRSTRSPSSFARSTATRCGGSARPEADDARDVRVVAATHAPLEQRVAAGEFRRDLFHRLECFVVHVPPLRERRGDIAAIARELLRQLAPQVGPRAHARGRRAPRRTRLAGQRARAAQRAVPRRRRVVRDAVIDVADIDKAMNPNVPERRALALTPELARAILREHKGNLSAAARAAGTARTTFRSITKRR